MTPPQTASLVDRQAADQLPAPPVLAPVAPAPERAPGRSARRARELVTSALFSLLGMACLVALWTVVAWRSPDLPTPIEAWQSFTDLVSSPFHDSGPNDRGIGLQLLTSIGRVFRGFGLAVLVGVPFGLFIGTSKRAWQAANPVIQLLRPVSPLAWFPIGLVVLKDSPQAAVFVIFITALWPIVINTAAGASSIPADQRNVARVFQFGRLAYVRHVVVPHTVPSTITGLRLSMGVAWMVIVAVEMLSGGSGIGFFVWDSYNGGNLGNVISAIVLIGLVGVVLDSVFVRLDRRYAAGGSV